MQDVIRDVTSKIRSIKGVQQVLILTDEDKKKVLELEKQAEQRMMMGLGLGDNQGVKEALKRNVSVAFVTDMEYKWPPGANVILTWKGNVIGEEINDYEKLEELKKSKNIILMGNFALYKDRMPQPSLMVHEPPLVILPPKPCPEVGNLPHVHNVVQGSPSPPADNYLKDRMQADLKDQRLGTVLLGFDLKNSP